MLRNGYLGKKKLFESDEYGLIYKPFLFQGTAEIG